MMAKFSYAGFASARRVVAICAALCAVLGLSMAVCAAAPTKPLLPLPPNSIYHLQVPLTDQNGRIFAIDDFRGKAVLISMFYSSCQFVCPRIVESLKRTEAGLPAELRKRVPVLMVSFDAARDNSAALKEMANERHLDESIWTLAHTDPRNTRKLAALLGVQYRELPSGDFNHTSVLILLDADGRIVGNTFVLGEADPAFLKLVRKHAAPNASGK